MKVLYVAPASDFSSRVADALRGHPCEVVVINDRQDYAMPQSIGRTRWWWWLRRRIPFLRRRSNRALQREILSHAANARAIIAGKGMNIDRQTLSTLRSRGVKCAVWFPENCSNEPYRSWVTKQADAWDIFISFDSAVYDIIPLSMRDRTFVVPFGTPEVKKSQVSEEDRKRYTADVVFIGAPYPDRVELLGRIAQRCTLKIWGWSGWMATDLRQYYCGPLHAEGAAKAYRLAKICVNTNVAPRTRGVNLKTFEICAAGGFQLTDECDELKSVFIPNVEVAVFRDADDFEHKIQYWLSHDAQRLAIARAGSERCAREHSLSRRVSTIMSLLSL